MTPERWATVEKLYRDALGKGPAERGPFLAEMCVGDDALRREVESLLEHDGSAAFLSTPAVALVGQVMSSGDSFIGQVIGPYVISARIGAGGMGEVYRARDQKLGRDVAIKVLPPAFTADAERLARFAREARVLAALNHPNIGAIYGLEEGNGINALVLELVEGETLSARIERGPIPIQTALQIARQIADALDTSHQKGIVHRDLKPANIKITPAGDVKVLDFGLAKAAGGDSAPDLSQSPTITVGGTHAGVILGTAAYMSPEQARGQLVDKQTDVWAFGCVLYEMLAGRPAFSRSTVTDTLAAILEREPGWTALPHATSDAIHRVLRRCLEKDARLRLHDIADARIEIEDELRAERTDRPLRSNRRLKMWSAALAVVVLAIVTAWAVSRLPTSDTSGPVLRLQINPPPGGQFGRAGSSITSLALSPDGKTLVYGATVNGKFALWLHPLDGTKATILPGSEDAVWPSWSVDGRYVTFAATGKLQRIDVTGGPPFAVSDIPRTYGSAWTPDHGILLGLDGGTLATVPASGGILSPLTTLDRTMGDVGHGWPQVLPGGHFLYWVASNKPENNGVIYAASFDTPNDRTRLFPSVTRALYASSRDGHGHLLWQRSGTLLAQEFDGATLRFSGEPRPIADGVGIQAAAAFLAVAVSNTGTLVYAPQELFQLTWFDRGGKRLGTLGDPGQYQQTIRFSPDGNQIAATRTEVGRELWLMDVSRGSSRRTTFDSRGGFSPQWSPDGQTLVFFGDNNTALYRKDATGVASDERLAPWQTQDTSLTDWSRDGRLVLNSRLGAQTGTDIWVVPVTPDGHLSADLHPTPYLRTPVNETAARFSPVPNPRWIAYQSDESGRNEVYIQSFPQPRGAHRVSTRGGTRPQWGPGGRELFYLSLDSKVMAVSLDLGLDTVATSEPRELFVLPPRASFFEMAPDGQRLLVNMPDPTPHPLTVIVNWPSLLKSGTTGQ